jgi:hypothetical protein
MTDDQVRELANLSASMLHITKAVDEIKRRVEGMPTREELRLFVTKAESDAKIDSMERRIGTLEKATEDNSATGLMKRIQNIALTVTAVAAAFGVVAFLVRGFDKVLG